MILSVRRMHINSVNENCLLKFLISQFTSNELECNKVRPDRCASEADCADLLCLFCGRWNYNAIVCLPNIPIVHSEQLFFPVPRKLFSLRDRYALPTDLLTTITSTRSHIRFDCLPVSVVNRFWIAST